MSLDAVGEPSCGPDPVYLDEESNPINEESLLKMLEEQNKLVLHNASVLVH